MLPIKDLQAQLLHSEEIQPPGQATRQRIIVLKHYRFHKKLSIELYAAATTQAGKLKNPLTPIDPLVAVLQTDVPEELKFYAAVSRFQNNPTGATGPADVNALAAVLRNPLGFSIYTHDPEFSEKVVAGGLQEIAVGAAVRDMQLMVHKQQEFYELLPKLTVATESCSFRDVEISYDLFVRRNNTLHLPANFALLKVLRFFRQYPSGLRLRPPDFETFRKEVLQQLEERISIIYTYARTAPQQELEEAGLYTPPERLIYLSDIGSYIAINPVMKYGISELPVRSKRPLYATNKDGELYQLQRDGAAEDGFIALLLRQNPLFIEQLSEDLPYFYLHRNRFLGEHWFLEAFAVWQQEGIGVLGFSELKENKYDAQQAKIVVQVRSGVNWFNADLDVRFGKKKAKLSQVQRSVQNRSRYVALGDGSFGILPEEWLQKFEEYFAAGDATGEELHIPKTAFRTVRELFEDSQLDATVARELSFYESAFLHTGALPAVAPPVDLRATLRPYQLQGLGWLHFLDSQGFGGCLADDMGLGKTVQLIAFLLMQRERGPQPASLIVMPTSLIFNWVAELERFAPSLRVCTLYGAGRMKTMTELDQYDVVLTSYGTLLADIGWLRRHQFNLVVLDEAHQVKNIESQRYGAVMQLQARNRFTMTGTPVENNTFDLFAQLSFTCPGLLGSKRSFRDIYSLPIDQFKESRRARELQQKVAPFVMRRTKTGVAAELPEKTEMVLYCPMGEEQRKMYDDYEAAFRSFIEGTTDEELPKRTLHMLRGLTRLRQICNSPLLPGEEKIYGSDSSKIDMLLEQIEDKAPVHKILVFSQFVSMLELIRVALDQRGIAYAWLTGATRDREHAVNRFQNEPDVRVFLVSLKAGGMGLNLTAADYVYLVDPWWNPAVENQAIDRAYRIGQEKHVVAVRLICPDTIEEKILKLQETKRELSENLVKTEGDFFRGVSREEWLKVLKG
jgi:superfamily II DNA or RNA helicase